MTRKFLILSAAFALAVSCAESGTDDTAGGTDQGGTQREPVDVTFVVTPPTIDTRADLTLNGSAMSVAWAAGEELGAYSVEDNLVDKFTMGDENYFSGSTAAKSVRLVYPYNADAVTGDEYSVSVASQTCNLDSPQTEVSSAMMFVSTKVITVADSVSVAMTYALAAMQFDIDFIGLEEDVEYTLTNVTLKDVPLTAKIDLTDDIDESSFVSYTSDGDMPISITNTPVVVSEQTYSVLATAIPFDRAAGEGVTVDITLSVNEGGATTPTLYTTVITNEAAVEYLSGGYYTIPVECVVNEVVEPEEPEEPEVELGETDNYYYYKDVTIGGRSADGGEGLAFFDCETGILYSECAVEELGANAATVVDFMGYANGDYFATVSPASATGKLKNYKCNDVAIATGSEPYTEVEAALYTVSTKFRALDPTDATHAAIIAAYESGTFVFSDTAFEGISDPGSTTPKLTPTLTSYDASTFSVDTYQYGYVMNEVTGMRGIIKYTAVVDATASGKYNSATFDLIWEKGYAPEGGEGGNPDVGTDAYYKYTNIAMNGRESSLVDGSVDNGSFIDCETGIIYTNCSVSGSESIVDFFVYDQSDAQISVYSPQNGANTLKNYKCDDVAITESGAWDSILDSTTGTITKFKVLDESTSSHATMIAAYEAGTIAFDDASLEAYDVDTPSSSAPKVTGASYLFIYNFTTDKYGVMKVLTVGGVNDDGRATEITFDLVWEK